MIETNIWDQDPVPMRVMTQAIVFGAKSALIIGADQGPLIPTLKQQGLDVRLSVPASQGVLNIAQSYDMIHLNIPFEGYMGLLARITDLLVLVPGEIDMKRQDFELAHLAVAAYFVCTDSFRMGRQVGLVGANNPDTWSDIAFSLSEEGLMQMFPEHNHI